MEQQPQQNPIQRDRYRDAEAQLGGADNVEKTTYVVGRGTNPHARKGEGPIATVGAGRAPRIVTVVVATLIILVALAYLIGVMR